MTMYLNIAKEFSPMPIGRFRTESKKSGEAFREEILYPKVCEAIKNKETLKVDFTDMLNLSAAFLEESFGGLVRIHELDRDEVLKTIEFISEDRLLVTYLELSRDFIEEAVPGKAPVALRIY